MAVVPLEGSTRVSAVPDSGKKKWLVELRNEEGVRIIKGKKSKKKGEGKDKEGKEKEEAEEEKENAKEQENTVAALPTLELVCESEEEMKAWVETLKMASTSIALGLTSLSHSSLSLSLSLLS